MANWSRKQRRAQAPLQLPPITEEPEPPDPPPPAGLGPNAPGGLTLVSPIFTGDTLPEMVGFGAQAFNAFGMGGYYSQGQTLSIVPDAASASGFALRMLFPGIADSLLGCAFPADSYGGQGPSRFMLRAALRDSNFRRLYVRIRARYTGTSLFGTPALATVTYTGTAGAGSTLTRLVDNTQSWTPNALVGGWVRHGNRKGHRILSNTATTIDLIASQRFDYAPVGEAYSVFTMADNGADGWNTAIKHWMFPRIAVRRQGSDASPGGGDGYGTPWSHDSVGGFGDNHFVRGWHNFDNTTPNEGLSGVFDLQVDRSWTSPFTEDGNGLPVWLDSTSGGGWYGSYPALSSRIVYTSGAVADEEYELLLNTPGTANGIYRHWFNGSLVRESTVVPYVPLYGDAIACGVSVNLGGADRRVALALSEPRWDYLYCEPTYGGGLRVPVTSFTYDLLDCAVAGSVS